jgi:hypothetical protein
MVSKQRIKNSHRLIFIEYFLYAWECVKCFSRFKYESQGWWLMLIISAMWEKV